MNVNILFTTFSPAENKILYLSMGLEGKLISSVKLGRKIDCDFFS